MFFLFLQLKPTFGVRWREFVWRGVWNRLACLIYKIYWTVSATVQHWQIKWHQIEYIYVYDVQENFKMRQLDWG